MSFTDEQSKFINYKGDDSLILSSTAGSGKEQPLYCKILTPKGWTTMGEINVGDEIITPKGKISKVIGVFPQGVKDVYKITFSDDSYTFCGEEHLWRVSNFDGSNNYEILETKQLKNNLFDIHGNFKYKIPLVDIDFKDNDSLLGIDSYLFSSKKQRLKKIKDIIYSDSVIFDGSVLITDSTQIKLNITSLVNSLGGVVNIIDECKFNFKYYVIKIILPDNYWLSDESPYRAISGIEYVEKSECKCIAIDDPEHLYITDNYIVTHNTHSCVARLNRMIEDGIDPNRIIFFSFTNDAVNELKSRINYDVKITTIHSFTSSLLGKFKLFKPIVTFYDFVNWYKKKYKPKTTAPYSVKSEFQRTVESLYEDGVYIAANISAYKLQKADNIIIPKPKFWNEYVAFLDDVKGRDFSDMLIDTERLTRNPKYKDKFLNLYDYVFIDEYQDTSTLQMKILLAMKAKQYHLIGDKNQAIYSFSGANCDAIEALLKKDYKVKTMTLTKNFRSGIDIVEHSNKYSHLTAKPSTTEKGKVDFRLIDYFELFSMIKDDNPLTILARTNAVIKQIEKECLKKKVKMRYFNFLSKQDIEHIKNHKINPSIQRRLDQISPYYGGVQNLLQFIEENKDSETFITTIHKSKGREFPRCVVINSVDPELLKDTLYDSEYSYVTPTGEIDMDAKHVHYVAVTRPKNELYFMIYEDN